MKTELRHAKVNVKTWVKDEIPYPNKNVTSYTKLFKIFGRTIPVTIWFNDGAEHQSYTVRAGKNSDYSYTGGFYPEKNLTTEQMQNIVDAKFKVGKLIF
jgi:hypothetical protein